MRQLLGRGEEGRGGGGSRCSQSTLCYVYAEGRTAGLKGRSAFYPLFSSSSSSCNKREGGRAVKADDLLLCHTTTSEEREGEESLCPR